MKKYKVTGKHRFLKNCTIMVMDINDIFIHQDSHPDDPIDLSDEYPFPIDSDDIMVWAELEWIEEIEEKEFTKSDIKIHAIKFAMDCGIFENVSPFFKTIGNENTFDYDKYYNEWLKQRK